MQDLATLFSSKGKRTSYLTGIRGYDCKDDRILAKLAVQRANAYSIIEDKVSHAPNPNARTVSVEYDPTVFNSPQDVEKTLHTDATADDPIAAAVWRVRTKHRCISSTVTCHGNGFGDMLTPFNMIVTTGCAPNFMGTSNADEAQYIKSGVLDVKSYQAMMKLSFKRWLAAQDKARVDAVIVPFIGGGVYLNKLSAQDKAGAKTAIMTALKEAVEESQFTHIKEVIFSLPLVHGNPTNDFTMATSVFQNCKNRNVNLTVATADVFDAAHFLSNQGKRAGLINPGSDRTIGGKYLKTVNRKKRDAVTLEELICNVTDLAFVQARDKNPQINSFSAFPPNLQSGPQLSPAPASSTSQSLDQAIAQKIGSRRIVIATQAGTGGKSFSFQSQNDAYKFVTLLIGMGIMSNQNPKNPKSVVPDRNNSNYSLVFLSPADMKKLEKNMTATEFAVSETSVIDEKTLAQNTGRAFGITSTIWINRLENNNFRFSFKTMEEAQQFIIEITKLGITSETNKGQPKSTQAYTDARAGKPITYYAVFLNPQQADILNQAVSRSVLRPGKF